MKKAGFVQEVIAKKESSSCAVFMQDAAHWSLKEACKGVWEKGSLLVQSTQFNSKTQNAISNLRTGKKTRLNSMVIF